MADLPDWLTTGIIGMGVFGTGLLAYSLLRAPWERPCVCCAIALQRPTMNDGSVWLVQAREVPQFNSEAQYNQWIMSMHFADDFWSTQFGEDAFAKYLSMTDEAVPQWVRDEMRRIVPRSRGGSQ